MTTNTAAPGADTGTAVKLATRCEHSDDGITRALAGHVLALATALDAATDAARALGELEAMLDAGFTVDLDRLDAGLFEAAVDDGSVTFQETRRTPCVAIHALHETLVRIDELPPLPGDGDSGAADGGAT